MTTLTRNKINQEIFEAKQNVDRAERELSRAEDNLAAVLKKYHFTDEKEEDISKELPTMAYYSGLRLSAVNNKVFLRNVEGNDIRSWPYPPSLTELFETCQNQAAAK